MPRSQQPDDANLSELTDDDKLTAEYPPDEPLGIDEYGTAGREEQVDEPIDERVEREEPDVPLGGEPAPDDDVGILVEPDAENEPDVTAEAVAREVPSVDADQLAADDLVSGDSTRRDVAQERIGDDLPAEETAMHLTEEPPMGDGDGYLEE